jgi:hypothetical protein
MMIRAELGRLEKANFAPSRQLITDISDATVSWWKACETWLREQKERSAP